MQLRQMINFHKGFTAPVVLLMMFCWGNFAVGPCIYLALHGTYGALWLIKDQLFPDRQWQQEINWATAIGGFFVMGLYWLAPLLLISGNRQPSPALLAIAVAINLFGTVLHFGSDAQKHFTLELRKGLITTGFFSRCRNPNYLGELLIYASFALVAMHFIPWLVLAGFGFGVFLPNMRRKDISLSRYPEFQNWYKQTGFLLPKLFI